MRNFSAVTTKMSPWKGYALIGSIAAMSLLVACGDDSENSSGNDGADIVSIADKTVSGVSQKGPFVNGSSVTVQELDGESLAQTGASYEGKIKNDMGEFSVKVKNLESQYALLKANGFYRNEVTGEKSKSQVTLYALTDLSDRDEVNVNLLTHLAYERSLYLATEDSLSVGKAKKQAESEVLASFGIEGDFASAEDLSIFGTDDGAAALLAVSVLMQGDLNEANFSERLANYAADLEQDGKWDDFITVTAIADWASNRSLTGALAAIRNNIAGWGLSADVPAFEKYVNRYWWQVYSLGFCDKDHEGEVKAAENALSGNNGVHFICGDGAWRKATDIEKDTYKWEFGKDGDVKNGDVVETNCYVFEDSVWRSGDEKDCSLKLRGCTALRQDTVGKGGDEVWYICDAKTWREATDIEKDTYEKKCDEDGKIVFGNVNKERPYDCDGNSWRKATEVEGVLGGCVESRFDEVAEALESHYICESRQWRKATDIEKDTYKWKSGKDGDVKNGDVVETNCYVFEDSVWRSGNEKDCSLKLRGCTALRQDTVGKGSDEVWYICDAKIWREATDFEKDTFGWKDSIDGTIKKGTVTGKIYLFDKNEWRLAGSVESKLGGCVEAIADSVGKIDRDYYICKSKNWLEATPLEYDTYHWAAGKDGDSKAGDVNEENCYVYESKAWRSGNASDCSLKLRGCTALRQDTVGKGSDEEWHICDKQDWRSATDIEKDTATWGAGAFDGEVRAGQINKTFYYIYEVNKKAWRNATTLEKDTYDYINNIDWADGEEGETRKGSITDTIYIFESSVWRGPNEMESKYGICTSEMQDSIASVETEISGDWHRHLSLYVCYDKKWRYFNEDVPCTEFENNHFLYRRCSGPVELQYDNGEEYCCEWRSDFAYEIHFGAGFICENGVWKNFQDEIYLHERCNAQRENEVVELKLIWPPSYFVCQGGLWNQVSGLDYEFGLCTNENEWEAVEYGNGFYMCYENSWHPVSYVQYLHGPCTVEKEETIESVLDSFFICRNKEWKYMTMTDYNAMQQFGACSQDRQNEINDAFVCDSLAWRELTDFEKELGLCTGENEGKKKSLGKTYLCFNGKWYDRMSFDIPKDFFFNEDVTYGTLLDERDGQSYRTVTIAGHEWMAENLNYPATNDVFGKTYSWVGAMDVVNCGSRVCEINEPHRGVCPNGWHIPSGDEWTALFTNIGENNHSMMSTFGWMVETTDDYGLSIIPEPLFWDADNALPTQSFHWSSTQYNEKEAMQWYVGDGVNNGKDKADLGHNPKEYNFYVRCVKDEE